MERVDLFKIDYEEFKFDKPTINLFEAFAGVGSQAMALKRLSEEHGFELNTVGISEIDKYALKSYEAIHGEVPNYGDISKMSELPKDIDIFTYSFPCQDISLAGQRKGFKKGGGTRSGLLWEVERLLKVSEKPQVLLMENVKALASEKFQDDFRVWREELENMGYTNYWQILNAKDYGIPQNRERVFMVSILGEYKYYFPKPFLLELRLKDMLEDEVDEKYYLTEKQLKFLVNTPYQKMGIKRVKDPETEVINTIDTMGGGNREPMISEALRSREHKNAGWKKIAPTLRARDYKDPKVVVAGQFQPKDRDYNTKGGEREEQFETRKDELANAVLTASKKNMVAETRGIYLDQLSRGKAVQEKEEISTIVKAQTGHNGVINNMRIRKLSPLETWRLMGFTDEDFYKAQAVNSNSQLYKQAGNSIVVHVLYYIFKPLFKDIKNQWG